MIESEITETYLRLKQVLQIIPVSRSTWYRGIKAGVYPSPVRLSTNIAAWKYSDVSMLVRSFRVPPAAENKLGPHGFRFKR